MVDNENDIDVDVQEDFDDAPAPTRPSLKEAWEGNPILKIAALVLGGVVVFFAYNTFLGGGADDGGAQTVIGTGRTEVKSNPGSEQHDIAYTEAIKESNKQSVDKAIKEGGSALPRGIGSSDQTTLSVPDIKADSANDPLKAWRRDTESRRAELETKAVQEEEAAEAPVPDQIPLVPPQRPQPQARGSKDDQNLQKGLDAQMRLIIGQQAPQPPSNIAVTNVDSPYVAAIKEQKELEALEKEGVPKEKSKQAKDDGERVIVPGGSVVYAQLMNALNSDVPGPVLAHVLSGPLRGGRALGSMDVKEEYLVLEFYTIVKDGVSYPFEGIALDQDTTLTGMQTDVDHHYFSRVILPAAAEFIKGYASAVAETGTTSTVTNGGGATQETPEPDATEEVYSGLEAAGEKLSSIVDEAAPKSITVHVAKGTTMGILFLNTVRVKDAE